MQSRKGRIKLQEEVTKILYTERTTTKKTTHSIKTHQKKEGKEQGKMCYEIVLNP